MNRYPLWKYVFISIVLLFGVLYTLPNLYDAAPAVQVSSGKSTTKVDPALLSRVKETLEAQKIKADFVELDGTNIRARFKDGDTQLKARDALQKALNPVAGDEGYMVTLSLLSSTPTWMKSIHAAPMYLGLDLRGGVHFLLQVDMNAAIVKRVDAYAADVRLQLREKDIRHTVARRGNLVVVRFADAAMHDKAGDVLNNRFRELSWVSGSDDGQQTWTGTLLPQTVQTLKEQALEQNVTTLHNRINAIGTSEPVIQKQGTERIVVQLPGVQDTARAKDIIGRAATLELRMVDDTAEAKSALLGGVMPQGSEAFKETDGRPIAVYKQVVITGDNLNNAQSTFDDKGQPAVNLQVDSKGARIIKDISRENIGKRMAIILFEKGKGEVVSAPVIRGELGNSFSISGAMNPQQAADLALVLRAGSLAAPMEYIEERTIGPSLGAENIEKGFNSVKFGLLAIAVFMIVYYALFGVFSTLALVVNLLLLIAILSVMQATLTLPGIAAIAFTLGMAIDANVLVNERIREELRNGRPAQTAISEGYAHAWATILDSNVTTLIAGIALLVFGSGPIKGFAVVHCLGILTSMFSSVLFSRGVVNLWYGRRRKLERVSVGQVWRPQADKVTPAEQA